MGTSLSYQTKSPVPEPSRSAILEYLRRESNNRTWWAESLLLFDSPELPGHIVGDTKLFCLIDDDLADCFMAMTDAVFIIELLEQVSANHGVDWALAIAGSPCGQVIAGKRDDVLSAAIGFFATLSDDDGNGFDDYDRETLLAANPDR